MLQARLLPYRERAFCSAICARCLARAVIDALRLRIQCCSSPKRTTPGQCHQTKIVNLLLNGATYSSNRLAQFQLLLMSGPYHPCVWHTINASFYRCFALKAQEFLIRILVSTMPGRKSSCRRRRNLIERCLVQALHLGRDNDDGCSLLSHINNELVDFVCCTNIDASQVGSIHQKQQGGASILPKNNFR